MRTPSEISRDRARVHDTIVALKKSGVRPTIAAIVEASGLSMHRVYEALKWLQAMGKIERPGYTTIRKGRQK